VYVTHDQVEAMTLGQRVAVMRDGRIQQVDDPQQLYHRPTNLFVGAFIGAPSMNLVEARVADGAVEFGGHRIALDPSRRPEAHGTFILGIRPEQFEDAAFAAAGLPELEVRVAVLEELGSDVYVIFEVDAPRVEAAQLRAAVEDEAQSLLAEEETSLFNARVDPRTRAEVGKTLRLAVDPSRFHFFDPASGANLMTVARPVAAAAS
jgi:multiple sugar transport system ATP-binding protein